MAQVSYGTITITDTTDIEDIFLIYKGSSSDTTAPSIVWSGSTNDWKTDIAQVTGNYIWAITVFKYTGITITSTNYTDYYSSPVCLTGEPGESVTITSIRYSTLTTESQPADNTFTLTSPPTVAEGGWLWSRVLFSNNQSVYSKAKQGQTGQRGTSILKVTTAPTSASGTISDFTYSYRMSLSTVKSQSGKSEVLVGDIIEYNSNHYRVGYVDSTYVYLSAATSIKGADGQTYYTWIKYAPNSNPTDAQISDSPTNMIYIGIYTGTTTPAPSTASSYTWSKYVGADGGTGPQGVSVTGTRELYYLKTNSINPSQITASNQITETDRQNGWTSIVPTYVANGTYYTCIETSLSTGGPVWSAPIENKGLTNANAKALDAYNTSTARDTEINAIQAQAKHYWWDSQGAHVAAGENTTDVNNITQGTPSTYGFNSLMAPGYLALKYKDINFAQLATNSLTFYRPAANGSTYVQGKKGMDLTADALTFYKPLAYNSANEPIAAATLNANGLVLSEGGLEAGTKNTTDYIYLYSTDEPTNHTININNSGNKSDWRIIAGNKFGVDKAGNLYASDATISGAINADSGYIGGTSGWTIASQQIYSTNKAIGTTDSMYLATKNLSSASTIGGRTNGSDWRFTIGSGFGVTNTGKLYATGADISGKITVGSGSDLSAGLGDYSTTSQTQQYVTGLGYQTSSQVSTAVSNGISNASVSDLSDGSSYSTTSQMNTAIGNATSETIISATTLYYASNSTTAPSKPNSHISTNNTSTRSQWNIALPTYNESYPYLYTCIEYKTKGNTYLWSSVEQSTYAAATAAIKTLADAAAPKSDAVAEEQRIYYRSKVNTKPNGNALPSTWITNTGDIWNDTATVSASSAWSRKVTPVGKNGTSSTAAQKYLYLWTCIQKKTVSGTVTYGDILLDDSTTIIDGGTIITGTVNANAVNASSGTFDTANIPELTADHIKTNVITAINDNTGAVQIQASKVDIAGAAVFNNYSTTTQMNTAIGNAVDGIEIGGRNLHKHSDTIDSAAWVIANGTNNNGTVTLNRTTSETRIYQMPANGYWTWEPDTTYTASIEAKGNSGGEALYLTCNGGGTVSYKTSNPTLTTSWKRYSRTFTTSGSVSTGSMTYESATNNSTIQVRNPKLEIGNKATDWTPAPEDVDVAIATAQNTANGANDQEQLIYRSASSGTSSMSGTTTWVTSTSDSQNAWTTKRPTYSSSYPVLFVATQRKSVAGTVTCTTPLKDDTTTIIDGGHITTGTIDASRATITNIDATKITVNKIQASQINTGSITVGSLSDGSSYSNTTQMNSAIKGAVNDIDVGGRNLFLETGSPITWTIPTIGDSGYAVKDFYKTYTSINQLFKVDDLVTISFDWSTTATSGNMHVECGNVTPWTWGTIVNAIGTRDATSYYIDITSSNKAGHVEITYKVTSQQTSAADTFRWLRMRVDGASAWNGKTLTISNAKCEFGNKATSWTPALEDDACGKNLMRYTHKLSTGSFATASGTFSTGSDSRVPSGQFLRATMSAEAAGGVHISTSALDYDYNAQMVNGFTYTFSAWVRSSMAFKFSSLGPERFAQKSIKTWTVPANEWTFVWCTGVFDTTTTYQSCSFYTSATWTVGATLDISSMKLELGTQPTPWTPAPGDMAISYMHADSSGLRIASANPSTQNQRILLTSSSISMYSSDNFERLKLDSGTGVVVGRSDKGHTTVNDNGLYIYDINNKKRSDITASGLGVYDTDGSTSVASFGATARVGKEASGHATIKADGLHVWKGTESTANNEVATFTSGGASIVSTSGNYISDFEIYNQSDIAYISTSARSNYNLGGFIIKNTSGNEDIDAAIALSAAYSNISSLASALEMLLSLSSSNGLKMVVAGNEKFSVSNQGAVSVGGYKLITTGTVSKAGSSISGGGYDTISVSATKTGYTPIGIIGYQITGTNSQNIVPYRMYLNGTTAEARVKNVGSSAITPSVTFYILYIASTQGI